MVTLVSISKLWGVVTLILISSSRLLQRVKLAHLRCNPQYIMWLVCHCTECTHTQYAPVRYSWLYIPLFCLLIQYQKLFLKILKNFVMYREYYQKFWEIISKYLKEKLENFENCCGEFPEYFLKFRELFSKILRIKLFRKPENYFGKFWKFSGRTEKYYQNFWEIILKYSKGISENFEKYCREFWEIFRKISKAISKNVP